MGTIIVKNLQSCSLMPPGEAKLASAQATHLCTTAASGGLSSYNSSLNTLSSSSGRFLRAARSGPLG